MHSRSCGTSGFKQNQSDNDFKNLCSSFWLGYLLCRSQEAVRSEEDEFEFAPVVDDELE